MGVSHTNRKRRGGTLQRKTRKAQHGAGVGSWFKSLFSKKFTLLKGIHENFMNEINKYKTEIAGLDKSIKNNEANLTKAEGISAALQKRIQEKRQAGKVISERKLTKLTKYNNYIIELEKNITRLTESSNKNKELLYKLNNDENIFIDRLAGNIKTIEAASASATTPVQQKVITQRVEALQTQATQELTKRVNNVTEEVKKVVKVVASAPPPVDLLSVAEVQKQEEEEEKREAEAAAAWDAAEKKRKEASTKYKEEKQARYKAAEEAAAEEAKAKAAKAAKAAEEKKVKDAEKLAKHLQSKQDQLKASALSAKVNSQSESVELYKKLEVLRKKLKDEPLSAKDKGTVEAEIQRIESRLGRSEAAKALGKGKSPSNNASVEAYLQAQKVLSYLIVDERENSKYINIDALKKFREETDRDKRTQIGKELIGNNPAAWGAWAEKKNAYLINQIEKLTKKQGPSSPAASEIAEIQEDIQTLNELMEIQSTIVVEQASSGPAAVPAAVTNAEDPGKLLDYITTAIQTARGRADTTFRGITMKQRNQRNQRIQTVISNTDINMLTKAMHHAYDAWYSLSDDDLTKPNEPGFGTINKLIYNSNKTITSLTTITDATKETLRNHIITIINNKNGVYEKMFNDIQAYINKLTAAPSAPSLPAASAPPSNTAASDIVIAMNEAAPSAALTAAPATNEAAQIPAPANAPPANQGAPSAALPTENGLEYLVPLAALQESYNALGGSRTHKRTRKYKRKQKAKSRRRR